MAAVSHIRPAIWSSSSSCGWSGWSGRRGDGCVGARSRRVLLQRYTSAATAHVPEVMSTMRRLPLYLLATLSISSAATTMPSIGSASAPSTSTRSSLRKQRKGPPRLSARVRSQDPRGAPLYHRERRRRERGDDRDVLVAAQLGVQLVRAAAKGAHAAERGGLVRVPPSTSFSVSAEPSRPSPSRHCAARRQQMRVGAAGESIAMYLVFRARRRKLRARARGRIPACHP